MKMATCLALAALTLGGCSGDDDANDELSAAWTFESGDCTSNAVNTVRVTVTPSGGAAIVKEFACSAGSGALTKISAGSYGIEAEGLDAAGSTRFTATQSASFPSGKVSRPLDITLRAKASTVTVAWNGCPSNGVILPYFVTLYRATSGSTKPDASAKVASVQESCSSKSAKLENVAPGSYLAEVDSRAVSPAVRGTAPVTVIAGEDASVSIAVP